MQPKVPPTSADQPTPTEPVKTTPTRVEEVRPVSGKGINPNYQEDVTGESQNKAGVPKEFLGLFEHDPSEVLLLQALKHPIGRVGIYLLAIISIALVMGGAGIILGDSKSFGVSGLSAGSKGIGAFVALVVSAVIAVVALAAATVYSKSRMILTNQKLVFIQYHSLLSREVSQLNIGEVEDVNVAQRSVPDRIFKKGTITVETAGEQNNYVFTSVANPHDFAQLTIQAHEGSIAEYGN